MKRITMIAVVLFATGVCHAIDVKGLTLGRVYDAQDLADIFGNATCPKAEPGSLSQTFDSITCKVPISYLGIKTSAEIHLSGNWMARAIWIDISTSRLDEVEGLLTTKYGKPALKRGQFEKMVPGLNRGDPQMPLIARCTTWPKVKDGQVKVCEKRLIVAGGPYVEYSLSPQATLDPNDI